jgi:hypothetical protein
MKSNVLFLIFLLWILLACQKEEPKVTKVELIEQEVTLRIQQIMKNKKQRCLQESLERASTIVDSLVIARAKLDKDTLSKPPKPEKPLPPNRLTLKDTLQIKPFLSDSIRKINER